jgi:hypothetical protein
MEMLIVIILFNGRLFLEKSSSIGDLCMSILKRKIVKIPVAEVIGIDELFGRMSFDWLNKYKRKQ